MRRRARYACLRNDAVADRIYKVFDFDATYQTDRLVQIIHGESALTVVVHGDDGFHKFVAREDGSLVHKDASGRLCPDVHENTEISGTGEVRRTVETAGGFPELSQSPRTVRLTASDAARLRIQVKEIAVAVLPVARRAVGPVTAEPPSWEGFRRQFVSSKGPGPG